MAREQYTIKTQDKTDIEMQEGEGFSITTRLKNDVYLEIPPQSAIYIQGLTGDNQIIMSDRGYQIFNDSGNEGIEVDISLYQNCTSATDDSDRTAYNMANKNIQSQFKVHTNPQGVVLGDYRGDLSSSIKTESKAVNHISETDKQYLMPLNDKSILVIENFNTNNELLILFNWQYIEKGVL